MALDNLLDYKIDYVLFQFVFAASHVVVFTQQSSQY